MSCPDLVAPSHLGQLNSERLFMSTSTPILDRQARLANELGTHMGRNPWAFISRDETTGELTVYSNLRPEEIRALVKAYVKPRRSDSLEVSSSVRSYLAGCSASRPASSSASTNPTTRENRHPISKRELSAYFLSWSSRICPGLQAQGAVGKGVGY